MLAFSRIGSTNFGAGERAHFKTAKDKPAAEPLYVSSPFVITLNVYVLNLVKIWVDAQNPFGSIVSATLDPEYFQVLLNSVAREIRIAQQRGQSEALVVGYCAQHKGGR